jgi:hypothetical protein
MQGKVAVAAAAPGSRRWAESWRKNYFPAVSLAILILVLIAFSDNLFTDTGQESNRNPLLVVHGLFALAWVLLFFVQAMLIRSSAVIDHQRLGVLAVAIAVGVVVSTAWLFVVVWKGWDAMPFHVKANRLFLPAFAIAVALAVRWRKVPALHKRMILIATLFTLLPVNDRAADHLAINPYLFNIVVWNAFWLSLFAYDRLTAGRVQRVTWTGFLAFYAIWLMAVLS